MAELPMQPLGNEMSGIIYQLAKAWNVKRQERISAENSRKIEADQRRRLFDNLREREVVAFERMTEQAEDQECRLKTSGSTPPV